MVDTFVPPFWRLHILHDTMEKLELKHIAPYLPYKVRMYYDVIWGHDWELDIKNLSAITDKDKLILRPLSDLTKYKLFSELEDTVIDYLDYRFPHLIPSSDDESKSIGDWLIDELIGNENYKDIPYCIIEVLFKIHFDVFGLIDKGLAIDINKAKEGLSNE